MQDELELIHQMTGPELIRLAEALGVPLTYRHVSRAKIENDLVQALKLHWQTEKGKPVQKLDIPALKISNLHKEFGSKVAVANLDLEVHPGEIVGLVGPNGAGKSTTLRVLTGIIKPTNGQVTVNGYDIRKEPVEAKRRIGYIPERPTCYPSLRVIEYLTFVARIYDVPRINALLRIREFVSRFQLDEFLNSYIGTLSKGNLQRTLLAGIFVREPPFILALDEPIYGLDPRGAWSLKSLLRELRDDGSAILISTHILEVAEALCDRFVIMNHGKVVGTGTIEQLRESNPGATSLEEIFLMLTGGIPEV